MARKKKKSEDNLDTDNGLEEEKGGGIAGALLAVAIIVIWLVIFALLIRWMLAEWEACSGHSLKMYR